MQRFEREIEIEAPVERVFDMLGDFENYPRWMEGVREVRRADRRRTHWVVETALETDVEWDAETVVYAPDHRIAWRTVHGDVQADGEAVLTEMRPGSTHLRFMMGYDTPGGRTGERVARFFGEHPEKRLADDLRRLKRLAERGTRRGDGRGESQRGANVRDERRDVYGVPSPSAKPVGQSERLRGTDGEVAKLRQPSFDEVLHEARRSQLERMERYERASRSSREDDAEPHYALTPRERERKRDKTRTDGERRHDERFEQRGVDKLLDDPPSRHWRRH